MICYDTEVPLRMMEAIQSRWQRELGVHITIAQLEQKTLFQNQQDKNYSIAFSGWIGDYPDPNTFLGTMVTGGGNNWAGWSNKEFDRLIDQAANTADNSARLELFQRAEAILLGESPLIPIFYQYQVYAKEPRRPRVDDHRGGFPRLDLDLAREIAWGPCCINRCLALQGLRPAGRFNVPVDRVGPQGC